MTTTAKGIRRRRRRKNRPTEIPCFIIQLQDGVYVAKHAEINGVTTEDLAKAKTFLMSLGATVYIEEHKLTGNIIPCVYNLKKEELCRL